MHVKIVYRKPWDVFDVAIKAGKACPCHIVLMTRNGVKVLYLKSESVILFSSYYSHEWKVLQATPSEAVKL